MTPPAGKDEPTAAGLEPGADTAYRVRVQRFEGPLDLLLHLVRINEVDILDIPIVEITDQYDAYLEAMRELNLDVAGDYLVVAATLMHIKSRLLLPADPTADEDGQEDPRAELVRELLDYQRFKQAAETLQALDSRRNLVWTRPEVPEEFRDEELLAVGLFDLLEAFRGLLGRLGEEARLQLRRDTVSVAEKINWLGEILERRRSVDLLTLLADLPTRLDRIATFLALLEMIRLRLVVAFQRKALGEIRIARVEAPAEAPDDVPATDTGGAGEGEP